MPALTTSNRENLAASLIASSQLAPVVGPDSPADGPQSQAQGDAPTGTASVQRLSVQPRHVADGTVVRASVHRACGGAAACKPAGHWLATLKRGMSRTAGAATAHIPVMNTNTPVAAARDTPTTMSLAQEADIKEKITVKVYWDPRAQSRARHAERQGTPRAQMRPPPAALDTPRAPAMPALADMLATQVVAHMQGRAVTSAQTYLATLATQQRHRGEAALSALAGTLGRGAQAAPDGEEPAERGVARQATEAWLIADLLQNPGGPGTGQPLFIVRLNEHIDKVLDTLTPDALSALYRRLTVDSALWVPSDPATLMDRTGTLFNRVGVSAAGTAWAASRVCELAGVPLSTQALAAVLRDAVAAFKPDAAHDETALMSAAEDLPRLVTERGQHLFMRQLSLRADKMLRDKGIPVNDLIGIATTALPETHYAQNVTASLRSVLASGPDPVDGRTARYLADDQIRQRLAAALDLFSDAELRAAAGNLLSPQTAHMQRRVQAQGVQAADRAALGRQFTILCEVLAEKVAQRLGDESGLPASKSARGWGWDDRFFRDAPAPRTSGLARLGRTAYRGLQRVLASVFPASQTDQQRIRHAYAQVVHAASGFIDVLDRNRMRDTTTELDRRRPAPASDRLTKQAGEWQGWTPEGVRLFNESGARLMQAAHQYEALCRSPAGRMARAELQLPGDAGRLFEDAFSDVIGKMAGERVNVLGATLFDQGWLKALHTLHEIKHMAYQGGPRPAQSILGLWFKRLQAPWRPPLGIAAAQSMLFALQNALGQEAGVRASAAILRELARVRPDPAADGASASHAGDTPHEGGARMLDDIRTLEQRFRPLDREVLATPAQPGADGALHRFIGMGMKRLSPGERAGIEAAVFNLDHRPPAWLEQDALWPAVVRCVQDRGSLA